MKVSQRGMFRISDKTYNQIEEWILAAEASGRNAQYGLNALAMIMARTNQAFAMEMSRGPLDPQQRNPAWAWRTPSQGIRRISSHYYTGWKVKRIAPNVWALFNASREAFFIEFGIQHVGTTQVITYRGGKVFMRNPRRIRRPVQKLSLMKTMNFVDQTAVADRVWSLIFAPFRPGRMPQSRSEAFISDRVQAAAGMRFI